MDAIDQNLTENDTNYSEDLNSEDELYKVPLEIVVLLSTFYGTISLTAVAGNGLVLWVVFVSIFLFKTSIY